MQKRFFSTLLVFIVLLFIQGCSGDDKDPVTPPVDDSPKLPTLTLSGPQTTSTDPMVTAIKNQISNTNDCMVYPWEEWFNLKSPDKKGDVYTRVWAAGGFTMTLTATVSQTDTKWKLVLNGIEDQSNHQFINYLMMESTVSANENTVTGKYYNETDNSVAYDYSWKKQEDNSVTCDIIFYESGNVYKRSIINKSDKSGEVKYFENNVLVLSASWKSDGSGQYTSYNENGTQSASGTWNK